MTIDLDGTSTLAIPSANAAANPSIALVLSVTHAFVDAAPCTLTPTLATLPLLITTTATLPSPFLNPAVFNPDPALETLTLTAPGLINRLYCPSAYNLLLASTFPLLICTICEFVFPAYTPTQYRYALALAFTTAWYTLFAHVHPSPAPLEEYYADVHAPCQSPASVC